MGPSQIWLGPAGLLYSERLRWWWVMVDLEDAGEGIFWGDGGLGKFGGGG